MSDAAAHADESTWAVHFPGNLRWSNAMQIVKGMAPYAAVAMDEIDRVGRRHGERNGVAGVDLVAGIADRAAADRDLAGEDQRLEARAREVRHAGGGASGAGGGVSAAGGGVTLLSAGAAVFVSGCCPSAGAVANRISAMMAMRAMRK